MKCKQTDIAIIIDSKNLVFIIHEY